MTYKISPGVAIFDPSGGPYKAAGSGGTNAGGGSNPEVDYIGFEFASYDVNVNLPTVNIKLKRHGSSTDAISVDVKPRDGTADIGFEYIAGQPQTYTWGQGDMNDKVIPLDGVTFIKTPAIEPGVLEWVVDGETAGVTANDPPTTITYSGVGASNSYFDNYTDSAIGKNFGISYAEIVATLDPTSMEEGSNFTSILIGTTSYGNPENYWYCDLVYLFSSPDTSVEGYTTWNVSVGYYRDPTTLDESEDPYIEVPIGTITVLDGSQVVCGFLNDFPGGRGWTNINGHWVDGVTHTIATDFASVFSSPFTFAPATEAQSQDAFLFVSMNFTDYDLATQLLDNTSSFTLHGDDSQFQYAPNFGHAWQPFAGADEITSANFYFDLVNPTPSSLTLNPATAIVNINSDKLSFITWNEPIAHDIDLPAEGQSVDIVMSAVRTGSSAGEVTVPLAIEDNTGYGEFTYTVDGVEVDPYTAELTWSDGELGTKSITINIYNTIPS